MGKTKLYPWQEECLKSWFANNGRGMVQAATGAGKTFLALTAAERLEQSLSTELRIKIIVPTGALMRQWERAIKKQYENTAPPLIGMRGGGFCMSDNCKYMIYVVNSARYELARQILSELRDGKAVLLIADECHHYESEQNRLIFEFIPHIDEYRDRFFSMGLSATLPYGRAQEYLKSVLGGQIYDYSIAKAISHENICQYDIFHVALSFQADEMSEYDEMTERMTYLYHMLLKARPYLKGLSRKSFFEHLGILAGESDRKLAETAGLYTNLAYRRKSLVCLAKARIYCAFDLIDRLPPDEKILIFGERILQAEELFRLLQKRYPGRVGRYHSQMGSQANQNTLERFRNGELRILIACKSLDEGFDVPDAATGIILSGTSMQRQRIQRMGRLLRKRTGKERASLYYLHIIESSEERCFLPESGARRLFELEYISETRNFRNYIYEETVQKMYCSIHEENLTPEMANELKRCIDIGIVRGDWLLERSVLDDHIHCACTASEKNYWICMKRLRLAYGNQ